MNGNSIWSKIPGLDPRIALILIVMGMFAITGAFELGRNFLLPYIGIWQDSVLTVIVVSASAAFIAFLPIRSLRTAETRLDTLLNSSPAPQFVIDVDHRIIFWNRSMEIATGIKASEMYGTTYPWRAFYPSQHPTLADLLVDGMIEKVPELYEGRITKSKLIDGSYEATEFFPQVGKNGRWFYFTASAVRDDKGVILGAVESFIDVTENKKSEEALKESHFLLKDAMDLAHLVHWTYDVLTGFFTFNDQFYTLYGTTAEREGGYLMPAEVYAREFVHPDDMHAVADEIEKMMKTSDPNYLSKLEARIIRRDGEIRYVIVSLHITKDAEGRTVKAYGANQDITERRQAEIALKESEGRFRAIFEGSKDAIMLLTEKGFYDCNPSALRIFGLATKEEFVKFHPAELSPPTQPDGRSSFDAAGLHIRTAYQNGVDQFEWVHQRRSGEDFPAEVLLSAFDWGGNRVLQATVRDISERKRAEIALKESEEQFLAFIKEAAMRLKTPLEVVEGNLGSLVSDIDKGEADCHDTNLQLRLQIKNLEQIRSNIIDLNKAIVDRPGEIPEASKKFLTE